MHNLNSYIRLLYGKDAEWLTNEVASYATRFPPREHPFPNTPWYKYLHLYFIYPDSIATGTGPPIARLIPHLAHVKGIGCHALHILPFLASPLVDAGFDVSDYMQVRPDLGDMNDVNQLTLEADRLGVRLFMDLVANHVSEAHEWFQRAQAGDPKYRNYFIAGKSKPRFVELFHKDTAVWARYIVNGKPRDVNVAFPEFVGEIPHWRQGTDGYWYYHTYYPQQIDLNWRNPDVFLEFAKIIIFWTSRGFNFRLDAIPFVGKGAYKSTDEENRFTQHLMIALRYIAKCANPQCVFIVETYEKVPVIASYFGGTKSRRAELAYNFHLCTYLWVALVEEDANHIWNKLDEVRQIPVHADWMNFLRNHDELSLAYLKDPILSAVRNALMKYGEPFREGYGISGRTYSLLGNDERRFLNAYVLLASLPGGMLIPYGDEFGKKNVRLSKLPPHLRSDTRNIGRGGLTAEDFSSWRSKRILRKLSEVIRNHSRLREYVNVWPLRLSSPPGVFAARYRHGASELLAYVNLAGEPQRVELQGERYEDCSVELQLGAVKAVDREMDLGPYAGIWLQT